MIEAVMFWNEPNNPASWAQELDPEYTLFAQMVERAARAVAAANPGVTRVLGGIAPIDASFVRTLGERGALACLDAVAVQGFPVDWNRWQLDEWPAKLAEIRGVTTLPIWVSATGVSSFGAEEVQAFGLRRTMELLLGRVPRLHWAQLFDTADPSSAAPRRLQAHGTADERRRHLGLLRADGTPKPAFTLLAEHAPALGIYQPFGVEDVRLDTAAILLRSLGVRHLRTDLSWADSTQPGAMEWIDHVMETLADFELTIAITGTPEHLGLQPHRSSPPRELEAYAEFCAQIVRRHAPFVAIPASAA